MDRCSILFRFPTVLLVNFHSAFSSFFCFQVKSLCGTDIQSDRQMDRWIYGRARPYLLGLLKRPRKNNSYYSCFHRLLRCVARRVGSRRKMTATSAASEIYWDFCWWSWIQTLTSLMTSRGRQRHAVTSMSVTVNPRTMTVTKTPA